MNKIAHSYAQALFLIAKEKNTLNTLFEDAKLLQKSIGDNHSLKELLKNPVIEDKKKFLALKKIFSQVLKSDSLIKFLEFLADKSRLDHLYDIVSQFILIKQENEQLLNMEVISKYSFDEKHLNMIEQFFNKQSSFKKEKFLITQKQDDSLIGGFKIKIKDFIYDFSIKTNLEELKKNLYLTLIK